MVEVQMLLAWAVTVGAGVGWASPGHFGVGHIGSDPVQPGSAWVAVGTGAGWAPWPVGGFLVEAGGALGRHGAVHGIVGGVPGDDWGVAGAVSARHLLVDNPGIRFAVTGQGLVFRYRRRDEGFTEVKVSPGLALDTGGERVRVDLAVPISGLIVVDRYVSVARFPFPMGASVGMSTTIGPQRRSRFRVGIPDGVSFHARGDRVYVDVGALPWFAGGVWLKLGVML